MQFDLAPSYLSFRERGFRVLTPEQRAAELDLSEALDRWEPGIDREAANRAIAAAIREAVLVESATQWRMLCGTLEWASEVAAREREACAKLAEDGDLGGGFIETSGDLREAIAEAIRARGENRPCN